MKILNNKAKVKFMKIISFFIYFFISLFLFLIIFIPISYPNYWNRFIENITIFEGFVSLFSLLITITIMNNLKEIKNRAMVIGETSNFTERLHDIIEALNSFTVTTFDEEKAFKKIKPIISMLDGHSTIKEHRISVDLKNKIEHITISDITYVNTVEISTDLLAIIELCKNENQTQMKGM